MVKKAVQLEPAQRRHGLLPLLLVVAATAVACLPVLRGDFFWDDAYYVTGNSVVRGDGTVPLRAVLTTPVLGHWHPLTIASLVLDRMLWGMKPFGFHLTNFALHLGNVALVFGLARRWSGSIAAAWVTALLFGIHPLRVEPVAWIASRKDLLAAAFVLIALWLYERWAELGDRRAYAAALGALVLGVLSKGTAVALALLLPVVDFRAGRRWLDRQRIIDKIPFVAIALVGGAIAIAASIGTGATVSDRGQALSVRVLYPMLAFVTYLGKSLLPINLSAFYPFPAPSAALGALTWVAPMIVVSLIGFTIMSLRWTRVVAFGLMFFTAAIVLMLRPVGGALLADRYTYVPAIGLAYIVGAGYAALAARRDLGSRSALIAARAAILIVACALGAATWTRAQVWRDPMTTWNDVLAKNPDAWAAWHARAGLKAESGDKAGAVRDLDGAIRSKPDAAQSFSFRGNLRADLGDSAGARADYAESLRLKPDDAETLYNLGYLELEAGQLREAADAFTRALELDPKLVAAWFNRAEARSRLGELSGALADYGEALARDRTFAPAMNGRAKVRFALGDPSGAALDLTAAARLGFSIDQDLARAVAARVRADGQGPQQP